MWAEDAIAKVVYPEWWTTYQELCGDRPVVEDPRVEPCGESEGANKVWIDALSLARQETTNATEIYQRAFDAAAEALGDGEDEKLTCIAIQLGYTTGLGHCEIIDAAVTAVSDEDSDETELRGWAEEYLTILYSWYTPDLCPVVSV